jgi:pteridine reductase
MDKFSMDSPLRNSAGVALITGAGPARIGQVVAGALARRGYRLALHYHRSKRQATQHADEYRQAGVDVLLLQADVSRSEDVEQMFRQVMETWGRVDVLVTTASIWSPQALEQVTADDVLQNFRVNTLGTFLCCQHGGLIMTRQESGGAIITFGDWAIERPYPDYAPYFLSKGSIPTLTRTMAVELASRNPRVRVNCIHPGPVMFPDSMPASEREEAIATTLLKTADVPEAVAQGVLFFVDNPMTTGVCLPIDSGRTIYAPGEARTS